MNEETTKKTRLVKRTYVVNGFTGTIPQIAKQFHVSEYYLREMIHNGHTAEGAIEEMLFKRRIRETHDGHLPKNWRLLPPNEQPKQKPKKPQTPEEYIAAGYEFGFIRANACGGHWGWRKKK